MIELLVVIVIIALLIGLILPAVQAARSMVRRMSCQNNMRQTGFAVLHYAEVNCQLPPLKCVFRYKPTSAYNVRHGMVPFILPFIEQNAVAAQYHFEENWQAAENKTARNTLIALLLCPASERTRFCRSASNKTDIEQFFCSDYAGCDYIGSGGTEGTTARKQLQNLGIDRSDDPQNWHSMLATAALGTEKEPAPIRGTTPTVNEVLAALAVRPVTLESITDGLSNSMMLFECTDRPTKYGQGMVRGDPEVSPKEPILGARWADDDSQIHIKTLCSNSQIINCSNNRTIFSAHSGGCNVVYGDGSVRFHRETISPEAFVSLFTAFAGDSAENP